MDITENKGGGMLKLKRLVKREGEDELVDVTMLVSELDCSLDIFCWEHIQHSVSGYVRIVSYT